MDRKQSLRGLLAASQMLEGNVHGVVQGFAQWPRARRALLRSVAGAKAVWSPELSNQVYSTQLWQLVKTWEVMQEFGLEGRGRELFGGNADSRTWCNTPRKIRRLRKRTYRMDRSGLAAAL